MCYYSQSAVHPLKFSPCWTFGTPVLSVFKLLKFLLLFIYSFESLNFTSLPLVLFSCSRPSLSFSLSLFWLSFLKILNTTLTFHCYLYAHDSQTQIRFLIDFELQSYILFIINWLLLCGCDTYLFHERHHSHINTCTTAIHEFLPLICGMWSIRVKRLVL